MTNHNLRPHHLLCISFFKGKGYSQDFVENMATVISDLRRPNSTVTIVNESDDICKACPNNIDGRCTTQDKVDRYDNSLLALCNLSVGQTLTYDAFKQLVFEKILLCDKRTEICGDCQWSDICK
jgi:hypothetical protein